MPSQGFPHGPMRRKDREITDRAAIDAVLDAGKVLYLALCDEDTPFLVPVFYAYVGNELYFHSSRVGTKMSILKRNPKVCFAVSLDHGVIASEDACDFEASHRTVVGLGRASVVEDEGAKIAALDRIVARFTERRFDYPKTSLAATAVVHIVIDSIKGKTHGLR
jgi:nitroimidazol reductase NimA-like FMN-containing flavoprotein (pyridoxamine 5'-phosphate oxidase superfamily)